MQNASLRSNRLPDPLDSWYHAVPLFAISISNPAQFWLSPSPPIDYMLIYAARELTVQSSRLPFQAPVLGCPTGELMPVKGLNIKCSICVCVLFDDDSRHDDGYDSRYGDDDDDKFLRHDLVVFRDPIVLRWLQQDPVVAVFGWYPVSRGAEVEYLLDS